jgi:DNA-binding beta-propeller fold protein YncE
MRASIAAAAFAAVFPAVFAASVQAQSPSLVLVANQGSRSATLIDVASGASTEIIVGAGPHEAAILPGAKLGVVTVYGVAGAPGNQLAIIDLEKKALARMIDLGQYTRPHGVVPVPGKPELVAVTSESTRNLVIVNVSTGAIDRAMDTQAGGSHMAALPTRGPVAGTRAYTANIPDGSMTEFDLVRGAFTRVVPVSSMTEGIAVTPDGAEVWMGSNNRSIVSVVDIARGAVVDTIVGFQFPYRIGISPDGNTAVVVDPPGDAVVIVDVKSRTIRGRIAGMASPRGVSISADSKTAMITSAGSSSVILVDLMARKEIKRFPVGTAPDGVAYVPD